LISELLKSVSLGLEINIDNLVNFISPSIGNLNFVAEGGGYYAANVASTIFKALIGVNVGCFYPREYSLYIAPYVNDDLIVFLTRGSPVPPRIVDAIKTCSILGLKSVLIGGGKFSDNEECLDYADIIVEVKAPENKLSSTHYLAILTLLIRLAGTLAEKLGNMRSIEMNRQLNQIPRDSFDYESSLINNILLKIINHARAYIYSGYTMYGLAAKVSRDLNVNLNANCIPVKLGQHPYVTRRVKMSDYVVIFKTELETNSAREIANFLRIRGIEVDILDIMGDPLVAPIETGIILLSETGNLISSRDEIVDDDW